jgi:3-oxoacyl-(acyl-carrier-protein) synthase III
MAETTVGILGTGSHVPEEVVDNEKVAALVGVETEWIERKTQIMTRRYAAPVEATSDLAAEAARKALESSGLRPADIDFLIVSTATGDMPLPPTSYLVQNILGATRAACFDINVTCTGFVYGLALAQSLIRQQPGAHVLVVAADVYSRFLDFSDRRTAVLLGDGAGAAVVGATRGPHGFLDFALGSRGDAHGLIWIEAGGSRLPASEKTVAEGGHYLRMEGRAVRDFVLTHFPPMAAKLARDAGVELEQIDHFVSHQPNGVLLGELAQEAGLGHAQTHRTIERYGNMGSASVAVTFDEAARAGRFTADQLVLMGSFGGGMSMGATLLRWPGAS